MSTAKTQSYSWTYSRSTGRKDVSSDERMEIIQSYSNDNGRKKEESQNELGSLGEALNSPVLMKKLVKKVKDVFSTTFCEFIPCINPVLLFYVKVLVYILELLCHFEKSSINILKG